MINLKMSSRVSGNRPWFLLRTESPEKDIVLALFDYMEQHGHHLGISIVPATVIENTLQAWMSEKIVVSRSWITPEYEIIVDLVNAKVEIY